MTPEPETVELTADHEGRRRVDLLLAENGRWGTRSQVHRLIHRGCVLVNAKLAKPGTSVRRGDVVRVTGHLEPPGVEGVEAAAIFLDVLYEDDDLLVINKPPGMVVHPAPGNWQGTLVSALLHRWQGAKSDLDERRPGIVHRLDRDTSGVLIIGKNAAAVEKLGAQFRRRAVQKEYEAVVFGSPRHRRGVIDRPIGRHPTQRKRMAVRAGGRAAVTRYEVVESFGDAAHVRARPETGRTHQIRVHLAAIGHPVVGDKLYGRGRSARDPMLGAAPRQMLHAAAVGFRHPRTGEPLRVRAELPDDMASLLGHLRGRAR